MLDCETPLGKTFIDHQKATQKILESKGYTVLNMSTKDAGADVIIAKPIENELTVCGVAEIRSRKTAGGVPLTYEYLKSNGGYLVTHDKLKFGQSASYVFSVPFFLIVNLLVENKILVWKVTDDQGLFEFEFPTKKTSTQMTCNGGSIIKENSFLPVDKATVIDY